MKITQIFRMSIKSLMGNRLRTFLTMLGMIIGISSVIMALSLMDGIYEYNMKMYVEMGANTITVNVKNRGTRRVETEAMYKLAEDNKELFQGFSPVVSGYFTLKNKNKLMDDKEVTGVDSDYQIIKNLTVGSGRFISYGDVTTRNKICVIGTYTARELFGDETAIGKTLAINDEAYTIVGILEEKEEGREYSQDDCVYVPYTNASRLTWTGDVSRYLFGAYGLDQVRLGEEIIGNKLYDTMRNKELYTVATWLAIIAEAKIQLKILKTLASCIAGISLAVAGIGIMNIMLVSVVERTREIGIRKALGAKQRDIMRQFIYEAAVLSAISGIIGILFSRVMTNILGGAMGFDVTPSLSSIVTSLGVSTTIGLVFGYLPAKRAARLQPIEALRVD